MSFDAHTDHTWPSSRLAAVAIATPHVRLIRSPYGLCTITLNRPSSSFHVSTSRRWWSGTNPAAAVCSRT